MNQLIDAIPGFNIAASVLNGVNAGAVVWKIAKRGNEKDVNKLIYS